MKDFEYYKHINPYTLRKSIKLRKSDFHVLMKKKLINLGNF